MPGKRWTQRELDSLIQQVSRGKTLPQIRIRGRSPAAVNQQRQRLRNLGVLGEHSKRALRAWTIREIRALAHYCRRYGLSAKEIVKRGLLAGRSRDAIGQQMRRQGLGDPARKQAAANARRLNAQQRAELERFLAAEGRRMASREVAELYKLAPSTIAAYRRRLKFQLSWHEARDSAGFRQRQARIREAISQTSRAYWTKWRAKRRGILRTLERRLKRRQASGQQVRRCVRCQEIWPALREFFSVTKRTRRGRSTLTMSQVCRACRAEQRL